MVERITSRRSTLRTLPALREEALPRPRAQRMCRGVHTESSADRSEMGQIDRSRRRRGCAGALRHKICTASLDNRPLIDGFLQTMGTARPFQNSHARSRRPCFQPWRRLRNGGKRAEDELRGGGGGDVTSLPDPGWGTTQVYPARRFSELTPEVLEGHHLVLEKLSSVVNRNLLETCAARVMVTTKPGTISPRPRLPPLPDRRAPEATRCRGESPRGSCCRCGRRRGRPPG